MMKKWLELTRWPYPVEGRNIMLNVRVAAPPWDRGKIRGWM